MTDVQYIDLTADPGSPFTVPLENVVVIMIPKYNYSAKCWTLDIYDTQNDPLILGLMLIPNIDILIPYPSIKELIGSLVLVELNAGDYMDSESLGIKTKLLWFRPGAEIILS